MLCHRLDTEASYCVQCGCIVCRECNKTNMCPFCSAFLGNNARTAFTTMLLRTHYYCTKCREYIPLQSTGHELICARRVVSCPFCHKQYPFNEYKDTHIKTHADELLAMSERFQRVPEENTQYYEPPHHPFICSWCKGDNNTGRLGNSHFMELGSSSNKTSNYCGLCLKHVFNPGLRIGCNMHLALVHPASTYKPDTNLLTQIFFARQSPFGQEAALARNLFFFLFIRSIPRKPTSSKTFICTSCGQEQRGFTICFKNTEDKWFCESCAKVLMQKGELGPQLNIYDSKCELVFHRRGLDILSLYASE